ncbi:MAG: 16S rRNA (cytosine(1402)-N(4))-methyltransferase [Candidatus Zambryskibacteria bacterium CG_4_9_14_3_um_filter_42_9]|uniref:Ribosomal RNA small subunit methyltransferase H n=1 Tax=Candidatus Zambryskibacteria bacterium CG22_combo_CG10-13_8_21_14_all_42_17 TaxID=1975118 RepID=A0A2H0BFS2_9BACT|nr:MAG: 16S rRNA (cytosine(1402)-N(4))-methyltransferase [Candidatus Zambryskibacteria bacterium CG22_combo_CG10-13_8_21_14_all_42_17]PJA37086.1 MAG: 16S rRNA (cytosine(1402)-N(4))-methyltransferase [Candidatus Zambryskibacteria bacterium CG_4_9_14_3_um_filter_42_9]
MTLHIPVLLHESIEALLPALESKKDISSKKVFLDGTLGGGGHAREVLRRFPTVRIIGLDKDPEAVKGAAEIKIEAQNENFSNLDRVLEELSIPSVDAILLDLGISSDQLESSSKGFSFLRNEPLDMRMTGEGIKATDILNFWDEGAIELILRGFGEEKFSKKIAKEIIETRKTRLFRTTFDLVDTILSVKPRSWRDKIHPATKTFQALRIAVNEELTNLEKGLEKGFRCLKPGGRLAVISFHSLEDRIVKNFFRERIKENRALQVTKKPITPQVNEVGMNPRSRSAKLRVIEKNNE